jgi:lipopolysaccharide transport system permease protein
MPAPALPLTVLEPGRRAFGLGELWQYRDLLYFLTKREISIRYKQSLLGISWAVLQPLMTMVVFTVFLGKLAKVPSDGVPYPVFSYLGLLPWTYFSNALSRAGTSLVSNSNLLSKVYVPRVLIPLSGVLSALVDFACAFGVLVGLMFWYGLAPQPSWLLFAPLVLLTALLAQGVGMGLAALNVQFRDVQHAVPFLLQLWMFATPVVYPASLVPEQWRLLFALNPMTGVIEAYRAAALGRAVDFAALGISAAVAAVLALLGWWRFRSMERVFADVV